MEKTQAKPGRRRSGESDWLTNLKRKRIADRIAALKATDVRNGVVAVADVVSLLEDKSPSVREAAAELIRMPLKPEKVVVRSLMSTLADRHARVRAAAVSSLGYLLQGQDCPPALANMLVDPDELVRIEACETLGALHDRRTAPALWRAMEDSSPLVRSYAAAALGQIGRRVDISRLRLRLNKEDSDTVKVGIYEALYAMGQKQALDGLISLLRSPDYRVRCATVDVLSREAADASNSSMIVELLKRAMRKEPTVAARNSMRLGIQSIRSRQKPRDITGQRDDDHSALGKGKNRAC